MKEQTAKTEAEKSYEELQKKLMQMLKDLPIDDEDEHGSCGHGCSHKHH